MSIHAPETRPPVSTRLTSLHIRTRKSVSPLVPLVPLVMVTAYDYPSALLADAAGVDMILVGDSLGMAVLGHRDTLCVTMEHIIYHCRAVATAQPHALVVADMPFLSYEESPQHALRNAGRLFTEAGARAVKLEGPCLAQTRLLVESGIPVMGHLGLTPQRVATLGGYRVQGRTADAAHALCVDALALQEAGCFALVLECVPCEVSAHITRTLAIPTIGIGAGPDCDGQVLVWHDMLGITAQPPKFARQYAQVREVIANALAQYAEDVRARRFPAIEHTVTFSDTERAAFAALKK